MTCRHHAIASKDEYTHDVMAGLSLRWAHMGFFFCLIDAFMFHLNEPRLEKTAQLESYVSSSSSRSTINFHPKSDISWL